MRPVPTAEQQLEERRRRQRELVAQLGQGQASGTSERALLFRPEDFGLRYLPLSSAKIASICEFLIHRGFIGVGYDGARNMRDEERHMTAETDSSPTPPKERVKNNRSQGGVVAIIALSVAVVIAVILYYGHATRAGWVGVSGKTFWDYLELLIVPVALAIGGYWLNRIQEREREAEAEQRELDRVAAEDARQQRELEFANQATQNAELQSYLDQMGQLLLDRKLRKSEDGSEVRTLAHARTLTVLTRLDGGRKARVVQFLFDSGLITSERPVLDLAGADLSGAYFSGLHLHNVNLSEADLSGADLSSTRLNETNLRKAKLNGADLHGLLSRNLNLWDAQLSRANLSEAKLLSAALNQANLSEANLHGADLHGAKLYSANLSEADLSGADLSQVEGLSNRQLGSCMSLEGATMPHGQKYEDWLKSKDREENGKNSGP